MQGDLTLRLLLFLCMISREDVFGFQGWEACIVLV